MRGPTLARSRLRPGPRLRLHHPRVERLLDAFGDVAQIRVARFAPCAAGVEVDLETVALRPCLAEKLEAGFGDRLDGALRLRLGAADLGEHQHEPPFGAALRELP